MYMKEINKLIYMKGIDKPVQMKGSNEASLVGPALHINKVSVTLNI